MEIAQRRRQTTAFKRRGDCDERCDSEANFFTSILSLVFYMQ